MSMREKVTVTCPGCGKKGPFTIWPSLNTVLDPAMKAKVLDGSLFTYECPQCGRKTEVEYGLLYHQMNDKIMIQVDETMQSFEKSGIQEMMDMMSGDGYLIRLVPDTNTLREKIHIFDDGLDDRLMEILKAVTVLKLAKASPEHISAPGGCRMYYLGDGGQKKLLIYAEGLPEACIDITEPYEELCNTEFAKHLPSMRKSGPVVDLAWGAEATKKTKALKKLGLL